MRGATIPVLSWPVVWLVLQSEICMLPALQSHGTPTGFHICFSVPLAFPQSLVYNQLAKTRLCWWMCSSKALMTFHLSSWVFSQSGFGVSILHTSFAQVEREVCLSLFLFHLCTLPTDTVTQRELAQETWLWGAEGSLSLCLPVCIHQLVCLHCQTIQEQWITEEDGLFHGIDSPCLSNTPARLVSSPPQLCQTLPWQTCQWVPLTAPSSHA